MTDTGLHWEIFRLTPTFELFAYKLCFSSKFYSKIALTHSLTHYTKEINGNNGLNSKILWSKSAENQSIKPFACFGIFTYCVSSLPSSVLTFSYWTFTIRSAFCHDITSFNQDMIPLFWAQVDTQSTQNSLEELYQLFRKNFCSILCLCAANFDGVWYIFFLHSTTIFFSIVCLIYTFMYILV